jgi:hypothetical protein
MGVRPAFLLGLFGSAMGLLTLACQGSGLLLPANGFPSSLNVVDGNNQRGTIGDELPEPLVVEVTDIAGRPVVDVPVRFQSNAPGANISPSVIATDDSGRAAVRMRLGISEGTQKVNVVLDGSASAGPSTTFQLTALARPEDDGGDRDDENEEDGEGGVGNGNRGNGGEHGSGEGRGRGRGNGPDQPGEDEDEDD